MVNVARIELIQAWLKTKAIDKIPIFRDNHVCHFDNNALKPNENKFMMLACWAFTSYTIASLQPRASVTLQIVENFGFPFSARDL